MELTDPVVFINGRQQARLSVMDRGLNYGHGLFETVRLYRGECPLWSYHLRRLMQGASVLGIPIDELLLAHYWQDCLGKIPADGILKLMVTGGQTGRGYRADTSTPPTYLLQWHPLTQTMTDEAQINGRKGIAVAWCRYRLPDNKPLAGIKHLNRLDQVLASAEVDRNLYQEGLLSDQHGQLIEGISRNIFIRIGNQWLTPDLANVGVAGVMRRYLIEKIFQQLCLPVKEEPIAIDKLNQAEEVFMCNSITGIWPVIAIEQHHQFQIGEQTRAIQKQLGANISCFAS